MQIKKSKLHFFLCIYGKKLSSYVMFSMIWLVFDKAGLVSRIKIKNGIKKSFWVISLNKFLKFLLV